MSPRPNFLVIGAARSGTTSIYHLLKQHPDIFMPAVKEPHFFSENWDRGIDYYLSLFDEHAGESAIGEASVSYTYPGYPKTVRRIRDELGAIRLIYVIREPIARTHSHYLYYRDYAQKESRSFEDALEDEPVYAGASDYPVFIDAYRDAFGAEKLKIVLFEDFTGDPVASMAELYEFLGVESSFVPERAERATNRAFQPRNRAIHRLYHRFSKSGVRRRIDRYIPERVRPAIRNAIRAALGKSQVAEGIARETELALAASFAPKISEVEKRIGRALPEWRRG